MRCSQTRSRKAMSWRAPDTLPRARWYCATCSRALWGASPEWRRWTILRVWRRSVDTHTRARARAQTHAVPQPHTTRARGRSGTYPSTCPRTHAAQRVHAHPANPPSSSTPPEPDTHTHTHPHLDTYLQLAHTMAPASACAQCSHRHPCARSHVRTHTNPLTWVESMQVCTCARARAHTHMGGIFARAGA